MEWLCDSNPAYMYSSFAEILSGRVKGGDGKPVTSWVQLALVRYLAEHVGKKTASLKAAQRNARTAGLADGPEMYDGTDTPLALEEELRAIVQRRTKHAGAPSIVAVVGSLLHCAQRRPAEEGPGSDASPHGRRTKLAVRALDCAISWTRFWWTPEPGVLFRWSADACPSSHRATPSDGGTPDLERQETLFKIVQCKAAWHEGSAHRTLQGLGLKELQRWLSESEGGGKQRSVLSWHWNMYSPYLFERPVRRKAGTHGEGGGSPKDALAAIIAEVEGWIGYCKYDAEMSLRSIALLVGSTCLAEETLFKVLESVGMGNIMKPFVAVADKQFTQVVGVGERTAFFQDCKGWGDSDRNRSFAYQLLRFFARTLSGSNHAGLSWLTNAADESFSERKFCTAIELYNIAVEHHHGTEQSIGVLSNRSACHLQNRSYDSCLKDADEALRLIEEDDKEARPGNEEITSSNRLYRLKNHVRKASAHCELGSTEEALQCYNSAVNIVNSLEEDLLKPLTPIVMDMEKVKHLCRFLHLKEEADKLFHLNHAAEAHQVYSAILKTVPTFVSVLSNRSSTLLALGRWKEAIDDCTLALKLLSVDQKQLAETMLSSREHPAVFPVGPRPIQGTVRHNSWVAKTLARRASAYFQLHEYGSSLLDFERAKALEPNNTSLDKDLEKVRAQAALPRSS